MEHDVSGMGAKLEWLRLGAAALVAVVGAASVGAEPLGKEACEALVAEQQVLIAAGIKADFAMGAEWGKANLQGDRLKQVGRYIDLEEQLSFRCGLARVRFSLPADEETPATAEEPQTSPKEPAPKAKPPPKAKAKAKAAEAKAADETAPNGARPKAAPKAQAKVKPAPKADEPGPAKDD